MADQPSKSGAVLGWIGGIVASVVSAVLIYHFTQPAPTPTPPSPIPTVGLSGVVADAGTHQLVHDAVVTVTLGSNSVQQSTDPSGAYSVVLPGIGTTATMGTVSTQAVGYSPYTNTVPLKPSDDNYAEISLESLTPPAAAAQPGAAASPGNAAPAAPAGGAAIVPGLALHPGIVVKQLPLHFKKPPTKYAVKQ